MMTFVTTACGRLSFDPRVDASADGARDSAAAKCDSTAPFTTIRPLNDLSSTMGDGGLRLSRDELTAYFHSERPVPSGTYYLFTATRDAVTDPFSTPVSTGIVGFFPSVSSDQRTLAYDDGLDVYVTTRTDTTVPFTAAATPYPGAATAADELQPYLTPDGSALYYTVESAGAGDVYLAVLPGGQGQSLAGINTGAVEGHPVISEDGLTLYFGSHPSAGTLWDIWRATRPTTADDFGNAAIISELETSENEAPTGVSVDNCRLYFESSRVAGGGMYDLYVAERAP